MATLEEVLVPIYLLHRFQVEAVANSLGGLYFTHAVKYDGEIPTTMVDPAEFNGGRSDTLIDYDHSRCCVVVCLRL